MRPIFLLVIKLHILNAIDTYDYNMIDLSHFMRKNYKHEPVLNITTTEDYNTTVIKNIDCFYFSRYALNCTVTAALKYNSTRKAPPLPANIPDWCSAITLLTECAVDWNTDCKDVTDSHFSEESIRGHNHVVKNICHDDLFLLKYDDLPYCIEDTTAQWEKCYSIFKSTVDIEKNTTREWTHYKTHFNLCCARMQFRRCTVEAIFKANSKCTIKQAVTLQRFSVIVSEGDVFQDCEDTMYASCPGGDPRPHNVIIAHRLNADENVASTKEHTRLFAIFMSFFAIYISISLF